MGRKINIHVNDEYYDMVPRPSKEDRHALKMSMQMYGQYVPISVNTKHEVLDGHTRFEICEELHLVPKYKIRKFANKYEEKKYILFSNLSRRHLSKFAKIILAWDVYEFEKKRAENRWRRNPDQFKRDKRGNIIKGTYTGPPKQGLAADIFARYIGTGHTVIGQVQYLKEHAPKRLYKQLMDGDVSISHAYYMLKGIERIPNQYRRRPDRLESCPTCGGNIKKTLHKICHVHRWWCCKKCDWGI